MRMPGYKEYRICVLLLSDQREGRKRRSEDQAHRSLEHLVAIRMRETPVPIPNTTVKTHTADGTSLETVRESRWPPEP